MAYCELPENDTQCVRWVPHQKWRHDPGVDALHGFAPGNKHYVNGELVCEDKPSVREASTTPFPRQRVPRRGFVAVSPDDPSYNKLIKEHGPDETTHDAGSPGLPNGEHSSPAASASSRLVAAAVNGVGSPTMDTTPIRAAPANGADNNQPISPSSEGGAAQARTLVNGNHGTRDSAD